MIDQGTSREILRGTVLYIEDDPVNVALVQAALSAYPGIILLQAETGHEGIRLASSEAPDLVLLDMHLPDTDGLAVVRELNEEIAAGRLRVILLTGDTLSPEIVKAMSLGAQGYWLKPIDVAKLDAALRRALGHKVEAHR